MKTCTSCNRMLPLSEYYKQSPGYYKPRCKDCVRSYDRIRQATIYQNDPDKEKSRKRDEYNSSPQVRAKRKASSKLWRGKNKEKFHGMLKKYYVNNKLIFKVNVHNRRARKAGNGGSFTVQEWSDLKKLYNFTCLCCGKREPVIDLTPDHVLAISKGGTSNIDNIQPLCLLCNKTKYNKHIDYRPKCKGAA